MKTPDGARDDELKCAETGALKLFIGSAPGVGKTYTMLRAANDLRARGLDVVIGLMDHHGRPETEMQVGSLEIIAPLTLHVKGRTFEEVNLQAICARNPDIVVIDELAHTNAPGSQFPKRYMDVEYLLDHGISVLSAVNVQHIEGIHEEAEVVTGISVKELIPAAFLRKAREVEVIDVTPETLRQRLLDGSIYPRDKVNHALQNFFQKSNLSGLRELALRVVAEDVEERLQNAYGRNKIPGPVGAKETIMVCVNYLVRAQPLISRGYRMAKRLKADLYVLCVSDVAEDLISEKERERIRRLNHLAMEYDAEWILEPRNDRKVGEVIMSVAERMNVTQIVFGQTSKNRRWRLGVDASPVRHLMRSMRYVDLRIMGWDSEVSTPHDHAHGDEPGSGSHPLRDASAWAKDGRRGKLTIYIGAAPGVGKTYKMLQDARDWRKKGVDVVVGLIETHGREETIAQFTGLEVLPKREVAIGIPLYDELDVEGILRRKPQVVLIDELAHTNAPGSMHEKRYQDILLLLERGIDVVTAVNVQHLESLHDKVEHITGVRVRERVPDWFMKVASEVKLIDVTPETLQQRLLDGKIYSQDKIERALSHFFQIANLSALREIALLEVADDVDQRMEKVREDEAPKPRERILVCVNHRPHSEKLIRRGWRIADRLNAELWVLVVIVDEKLSEQEEHDLLRIRKLSEQFDAQFITRPVANHSVGCTIVDVSKELQAKQLVTGQPILARGPLQFLRKTPIDYVLENGDFVDLHIVGIARDS
ncbi:histidine kinase [Ferroacidibacillus organovorans]|uniref:Histidine kinase n=1 Tax=Ferroacidibacillus organovorans TaxID=1765683 RepID=A0A1V4ESZ8_9BACL|nr:histidine kinase [Ferroacidibacillus organovorans]OPG16063.1 histidine kinase [Ferroacidibacillus organovorans]